MNIYQLNYPTLNGLMKLSDIFNYNLNVDLKEDK